jgi:hypothetical protein
MTANSKSSQLGFPISKGSFSEVTKELLGDVIPAPIYGVRNQRLESDSHVQN